MSAIIADLVARLPPPDLQRRIDGWDEPIPFDAPILPAFPVAALPSRLRGYVVALAEATQTPADLPAMVVLGVCAGAIARKAVVLVKPGYFEPLNLMTVSVAAPATRKTAVFGAAVAPIEEEERELAERARPEIAAAKAARATAEERVKAGKVALKAAEGQSRTALETELCAALQALDAAIIPTAERLIFDDVTPEKAAVGMAENGERMIIASPEGGVFASFLGRYSRDGSANVDVLLKGHAGDSLRVDRLGREPVFLRCPALTVVVTVQPAVIQELARKPELRGRGLLARFLYSLPISRVGERTVDATAVPDAVKLDYGSIVRALLAIPLPNDGAATVLRLDAEALDAWRRFFSEVEPRLHAERGDLGAVADWAGKLPGAVARIAGVLHCAGGALAGTALTTAVSGETMRGAIEIGRYLLPHALAAFGAMRAAEDDDDTRALLRWLRGRTRTTVRDVQRGLSRRFRSAEQVGRTLRALEERGFVRLSVPVFDGGPGRPSGVAYDVHPAIAADTTDKADSKERRL